jgi:hypothetical protein
VLLSAFPDKKDSQHGDKPFPPMGGYAYRYIVFLSSYLISQSGYRSSPPIEIILKTDTLA